MDWGERELQKHIHNSPDSQEKWKHSQTVRRKIEESEVHSKSVIYAKHEKNRNDSLLPVKLSIISTSKQSVLPCHLQYLSRDSVPYEAWCSGPPCELYLYSTSWSLSHFHQHILIGEAQAPRVVHFSWDKWSLWLIVGRDLDTGGVLKYFIIRSVPQFKSSLNCSMNKVCDDRMFWHKDISSTEEVIGIRTPHDLDEVFFKTPTNCTDSICPERISINLTYQ